MSRGRRASPGVGRRSVCPRPGDPESGAQGVLAAVGGDAGRAVRAGRGAGARRRVEPPDGRR